MHVEDDFGKHKPEKVPLVLDNNNENILMKITSNRTYLEFSKRIVDHEIGKRLLAEYGYFKPKKPNIFEVSEEKVVIPIYQAEEKKKIKFISKKDEHKPVTSAKSKAKEEVMDLNAILNEKGRIPKINMKYNDYFYNIPRCNVCDMIGITLEELKRISSNRQAQLDIITLDYMLLTCSVCKTYIHRNCLYNNTSAPLLNLKDKNYKDWVCERCTEGTTQSCCICLSDPKLTRKPYFIRTDSAWCHYLCYLWLNVSAEGTGLADKVNRIRDGDIRYCEYCMTDASQ
jgi:hypothetical protein